MAREKQGHGCEAHDAAVPGGPGMSGAGTGLTLFKNLFSGHRYLLFLRKTGR
jgi:hypothetical protein